MKEPLSVEEIATMADNLIALIEKGDALVAAVEALDLESGSDAPMSKHATVTITGGDYMRLDDAARAWRAAREGR